MSHGWDEQKQFTEEPTEYSRIVKRKINKAKVVTRRMNTVGKEERIQRVKGRVNLKCQGRDGKKISGSDFTLLLKNDVRNDQKLQGNGGPKSCRRGRHEKGQQQRQHKSQSKEKVLRKWKKVSTIAKSEKKKMFQWIGQQKAEGFIRVNKWKWRN
jgi:hypothetical protein